MRTTSSIYGLLRVSLMAAACVCTLQPSLALADQWLVSPSRDTSQATVTKDLLKAGLGGSTNIVLEALAGSTALASQYRLIDLETGEVTVLSPAEAEQITWEDAGHVVDAASAADGPAIVLVVSDFDGMGASIVTLDGSKVASASVLSADQRLLVGEPPCDKGFAPESDVDGTLCVDIDECDAELDNCAGDATCTNTDGSFKCKCDDGFAGDGVMCMVVDNDAGMMPELDAGDIVIDGDAMPMPDDSGTAAEADAALGGDSDAGMNGGSSNGCSCDAVGGSPLGALRAIGPIASLLMLVVAFRRRSKRRGK